MANLAIRGHEERGKEVIEILEMLGGVNKSGLKGYRNMGAYFIKESQIFHVSVCLLPDDAFIIFTLEEFLERFPYKVGDKVIAFGSSCVITSAVWDESINEVVYRIRINETEYTTTKLSSQLQPYKKRETKELWIARDSDGELVLHKDRPIYNDYCSVKSWCSNEYVSLPFDLFPEVTFENSPKRVKIELIEE